MAEILPLLFLVGVVAVIWFIVIVWFRALTSVMATEDHQFPGKHDKILWVALFLLVPIFAPLLYTACVERFNKKRDS